MCARPSARIVSPRIDPREAVAGSIEAVGADEALDESAATTASS
ncbi:MAG: hypothetical protein AAGJ87_09805 [Pseudomonadota bacterium]